VRIILPEQRVRGESEPGLHQGYNLLCSLTLLTVERIVPPVEIADHLKHEGAELRIAVVAGSTGGWQVPGLSHEVRTTHKPSDEKKPHYF
jgi:hypothetical protein